MKRLLLVLVFSAVAFGQASGVGQIWTFLGPTTLQSGATASGNGTAMSVAGLSSAIYTVNCSVACTGGTTINLEGTADNTNYVALSAVQIGTATIAGTITNQGTTITLWQIPIGALQSIRARISAYSAGTITVTATASAAPWDPKVVNANSFLGGTATDGNSGNKSAQTQRVVLATDQPALTNALSVQGAKTNNNAAPGATNVGALAYLANAAVQTWTEGDLVTGSVDLSGNERVIVGATAVTGNSLLECNLVSAASTNSTNCKASAGNFYGISFVNTTATLYYLRLYNASSAPTCSSATGFIKSIPIPASTTGAGIVTILGDIGVGYTTGIGFCFTGGSSSTDNTNAATGVFGTVYYK